jgi:hypothetical protein
MSRLIGWEADHPLTGAEVVGDLLERLMVLANIHCGGSQSSSAMRSVRPTSTMTRW